MFPDIQNQRHALADENDSDVVVKVDLPALEEFCGARDYIHQRMHLLHNDTKKREEFSKFVNHAKRQKRLEQEKQKEELSRKLVATARGGLRPPPPQYLQHAPQTAPHTARDAIHDHQTFQLTEAQQWDNQLLSTFGIPQHPAADLPNSSRHLTSSCYSRSFFSSRPQIDEVNHRRIMQLKVEHEAKEAKWKERESRIQIIEEKKCEHKELEHCQKLWAKICLAARALLVMRKLGNFKIYRSQQLRKRLSVACRVACCAVHWRRIARRIRERLEWLKLNTILRKRIQLKAQNLRYKLHKPVQGPCADMIVVFLRDLKKVFQIPDAVKKYVALTKQAQNCIRKYLLGRRMWKYALLKTWENLMRREVADLENLGKIHRAGWEKIAGGGDCSSLAKKFKKTLRRIETDYLQSRSETPFLMFIPFEFRCLVVELFITVWKHETVRQTTYFNPKGQKSGGCGMSHSLNEIQRRLNRQLGKEPRGQKNASIGTIIAEALDAQLEMKKMESPKTGKQVAQMIRAQHTKRSIAPFTPTSSTIKRGSFENSKKRSTVSIVQPPDLSLSKSDSKAYSQSSRQSFVLPQPQPLSTALMHSEKFQCVKSLLNLMDWGRKYRFGLFNGDNDVRRLRTMTKHFLFAFQDGRREDLASKLMVQDEGHFAVFSRTETSTSNFFETVNPEMICDDFRLLMSEEPLSAAKAKQLKQVVHNIFITGVLPTPSISEAQLQRKKNFTGKFEFDEVEPQWAVEGFTTALPLPQQHILSRKLLLAFEQLMLSPRIMSRERLLSKQRDELSFSFENVDELSFSASEEPSGSLPVSLAEGPLAADYASLYPIASGKYGKNAIILRYKPILLEVPGAVAVLEKLDPFVRTFILSKDSSKE